MGPDSFLVKRNHRHIELIITRFAKKFGVRIYRVAINSNHLHLLLRITNRRLYRAFIKAISGQIASQVMGQQSFLNFARTRKKPPAGDGSKSAIGGDGLRSKIEGGKDERKKAGFWEFRPFSRIVNWGKDFKNCVKYLKLNVLEAFGFIPYKPRKNFYKAWIAGDGSRTNTG